MAEEKQTNTSVYTSELKKFKGSHDWYLTIPEALVEKLGFENGEALVLIRSNTSGKVELLKLADALARIPVD